MEKYYFEKGFLDEDLCGVATQYSIFKHLYYRNESVIKNSQTLSGTEFYADTFTESIMSFLTPHIEKITGMSLIPSYSTLRNYIPGENSPRKVETNGSDVAAKICLGYEYNGVSDEYKWGIWVDETPNPKKQEENWSSNMNDGTFLEQGIGDIFVYKNDIEHWKEPMLSSQNSYYCEMTAYWIDDNSDKIPYDGRKAIGMRKLVK